MGEVILSDTKVAQVSVADMSSLEGYNWTYNRNGYAVRKGDNVGETVYMHRQLMGLGKGDEMFVDHINGNGLDNRRENLRICSRTQNQQNPKPRHTQKSKYKGVGYYNRDKKWRARIAVNKKDIELGKFETEIEAANAYDVAAERYHGEYAWLNKNNFDLAGFL